jgi:hypothetical protein
VSPCRCAQERIEAADQIRARVRRVVMTEAMRAEATAKQALYQHERQHWRKQWQEHYGIPNKPELVIDPAHVSFGLLLS